MQLNTWGLGRRAEMASEFDPEQHLFIERVRSHLQLTVVEIKGNGEPVQVALGQPADPLDPEAAQVRVTPFFSSFDALDFFCRLNLQHYLAFDPAAGLPRRWFWEDVRQRGTGSSARIVTSARGVPAPIARGGVRRGRSDPLA